MRNAPAPTGTESGSRRTPLDGRHCPSPSPRRRCPVLGLQKSRNPRSPCLSRHEAGRPVLLRLGDPLPGERVRLLHEIPLTPPRRGGQGPSRPAGGDPLPVEGRRGHPRRKRWRPSRSRLQGQPGYPHHHREGVPPGEPSRLARPCRVRTVRHRLGSGAVHLPGLHSGRVRPGLRPTPAVRVLRRDVESVRSFSPRTQTSVGLLDGADIHSSARRRKLPCSHFFRKTPSPSSSSPQRSKSPPTPTSLLWKDIVEAEGRGAVLPGWNELFLRLASRPRLRSPRRPPSRRQG